jgi:hypothetical protein
MYFELYIIIFIILCEANNKILLKLFSQKKISDSYF